ncbi:hypothetical protein [Alicyclobacillus ferrooxydans]|nr:hypothetical protein [Alicyclobacillus ferrooxydans]
MNIFYGLIPIGLFGFWGVHFSLARYFETQSKIDTLLQKIHSTKTDIVLQQNARSQYLGMQQQLDILEEKLKVALSSKNIFTRDEVYKVCSTNFECILKHVW